MSERIDVAAQRRAPSAAGSASGKSNGGIAPRRGNNNGSLPPSLFLFPARGRFLESPRPYIIMPSVYNVYALAFDADATHVAPCLLSNLTKPRAFDTVGRSSRGIPGAVA